MVSLEAKKSHKLWIYQTRFYQSSLFLSNNDKYNTAHAL